MTGGEDYDIAGSELDLITENIKFGGGKKKLKGRGAHEGGKRKCPIHCHRHTRRTRRALRKSLKHHKKSMKHHKKSMKHHKKSKKHQKKSMKRKSRKGGAPLYLVAGQEALATAYYPIQKEHHYWLEGGGRVDHQVLAASR